MTSTANAGWPDAAPIDEVGGRTRQFLSRLQTNRTAVSAVEFALILPIFVSLGMYGSEVAHMSTVNMEVSQIALSLADNASRLGQTENGAVMPTITEMDIDSVMTGAIEQGRRIDLEDKGKIILSSLEVNDISNGQYIHWQRCRGTMAEVSTYGSEEAELDRGVGVQRNITAAPNSAVMVAEIFYRYDGLFGSLFANERIFRHEAVYIVRDDRNLEPGVTGGGGNSRC